jgi:O-acetyl-ADP-ribose deacetylase (regulator of RNase III)
LIRVVRVADGEEPEAEAFLRSIGSDLEALTGRDRRLALEAGAGALAPLRAMEDLPVGGAVVTPAGGLPAAFLIHVVLRSAEEPVSDQGVRRAFLNGLRQAAEWGIGTLASAPLGTGAGNLEAEDSARVMMEVLREHRLSHLLPADLLVVASSAYEEDVFRRAASRFFPEGLEPASRADDPARG